MRIISGRLRGRSFKSPNTYGTHPMSDKIRGALFNMLGELSGLTVLDAFAGSGALAFEALSRGANSATLIEIDKNAFMTLKENIEKLKLSGQTKIIKGNVKGWTNNYPGKRFDLVFCDPPYDAVLEQLIHKLARHVADNGLLVLSWPTKEPVPEIPGLDLIRHRTYGNATLFIYQKTR